MNEIFARDLNGEIVSPSDQGYDELINSIWDTMKTAAELNNGYHTPEEVRRILGEIIGQEVDESVTLLPPFYVDYGKHIKIGKGCFIQQCCTFFGRGGITLGEHVLVGPKVNIITINHDSDPETAVRLTAVLLSLRIKFGSVSTPRFSPVSESDTALS